MAKRSKAQRIDAEIAEFIQAVDGYLDCERKLLPYIEMLKHPQIPYTPEHNAEHSAIRRRCRELFDLIPSLGVKLAGAIQSSGFNNQGILAIANIHGAVGGFGNSHCGNGKADTVSQWPAIKVQLQQLVLNTNHQANERIHGKTDRKSTTTIDRDLKWLDEFETSQPMEIVHFASLKRKATKKTISRTAMSKALERARIERAKRESSASTKNSCQPK